MINFIVIAMLRLYVITMLKWWLQVDRFQLLLLVD